MIHKEFKDLFDADKALLSDTVKYNRERNSLEVLIKRGGRNRLVDKKKKQVYNKSTI